MESVSIDIIHSVIVLLKTIIKIHWQSYFQVLSQIRRNFLNDRKLRRKLENGHLNL
jgi:hypothetical protein